MFMRPSLSFTDRADWKNYCINELCDILTGYPFEGNTIKSKGKNALMRGINITEGYIRHSQDIDRFFDGDASVLSKYRLNLNDLVIGMDGSKVGKNSALVTNKEIGALLVQRVARLRSTDIDTIKLLLQLFGSNRFFKYVDNIKTSSAIPHISLADIKQFVVALPTNEHEKNLLSSFCELVREHITLTQSQLYKLHQIKSACLQSMFPQEGESVPKVRFKGFNEEWKNDKLSKFVSRITRKNKNLESNLPLTISAADGLVSQLQYFNNIVASANLSGYYLIKNGEFAYNKSYSNGYPFGSIKRLDKYDMGALSTLYIVFGIKDNALGIDSDYLTTFFSTTLWHHEVAERAEEGARNHGLLNIGADDFLDINIIYPKDLAEQQQIAVYFENLDKQISLQTQRLEKLKQIKSACLDKMFV